MPALYTDTMSPPYPVAPSPKFAGARARAAEYVTMPRRRGWYVGWGVMTFLCLAIAGYAFVLLAVPLARPPFIAQSPYPLAVLAHFVGGGGALALGPWQFLTGARSRWRTWHRWAGRGYALAIIVGGVAGLILATKAQGGVAGRLGFGTLAVVWLSTLVMAVGHAWRGEIAVHRRWMVRNFALTLAAVTLRFYVPGSMIMGIPFERAYVFIAWLCWVPNLVVVEWMVRRNQRSGAARLGKLGVAEVARMR